MSAAGVERSRDAMRSCLSMASAPWCCDRDNETSVRSDFHHVARLRVRDSRTDACPPGIPYNASIQLQLAIMGPHPIRRRQALESLEPRETHIPMKESIQL